MSKAKARVFVPLTKVDEEQRLVYGTITQEILDKSGEVMDYDSSKPYFEKWSNEISEASGGLSKGNLRVMHGLQVAGKLTDINFDDSAKAIDVCAKVVDDAEWTKVLEGCYTGFSVGGKYEKRWTENGMKKYTAGPNEVSLVDNPCVGTATFALVKADGVTEEIMFKVNAPAEEPAPVEQPVEKAAPAEPVQQQLPFTNDDVVRKATEIASAANDGTTWMDHVTAARDALVKASQEQSDEGSEEEGEGVPATEGAQDPAATTETTETNVEKVTPPGVKQVWTASDGKTFEKKADAEAHEATLQKAAEPKTEAQLLAERLNKALNPETPAPVAEVGLMEDFDRLAKVFDALSTPFEDGEPKLEKGMYTVNRFSSVLSDMAALSRSIKREGTEEGGDGSDNSVSAEIIAAVKSLGASFITYATDQVQELLAGMDDDVVVTYYDYYYNAAHSDEANGLAKDVCQVITENRDPSREKRDALGKAFGFSDDVPEQTDELSPALQKRFEAIEADRDTFKKIAEDAVAGIETLTKRVTELEETPMPRAPNPALVALREGDMEFMGKRFGNESELRDHLHNMIKTQGPDALAIEMIKAAQAGGGQKLGLKS